MISTPHNSISVRKFKRKNQWVAGNPIGIKYFEQAGYHTIRLYDIQSVLFYWDNLNIIFKWCDENFGHEDWLFKFDYWILTHHKDAFAFKLVWC